MAARFRELLHQLGHEYETQTSELRKLRREVQRLGGVPRLRLSGRRFLLSFTRFKSALRMWWWHLNRHQLLRF